MLSQCALFKGFAFDSFRDGRKGMLASHDDDYVKNSGFDFVRFCVCFFYCSWDEWVVIDRLMKHTEENMRVKLSIDAEFGNEKNARKPRASSKASNGQIFIFYIFCYRE